MYSIAMYVCTYKRCTCDMHDITTLKATGFALTLYCSLCCDVHTLFCVSWLLMSNIFHSEMFIAIQELNLISPRCVQTLAQALIGSQTTAWLLCITWSVYMCS